MNVNTKLKLQDKLDEQLAMRNRELIQLSLLFQTTEQRHEKDIVNRLIIPHTYSHYEGFIKYSSILFLKYTIATYNSENELPDNIYAVSLKESIKKYAKSNYSSEHIKLINMIREKPLKIRFNPTAIIDTHENLKSEFLQEIMFICGINYDEYWQEKSFFIDNILLKNRNLISHGELNIIDDETVSECLLNVIDILRNYKQRLEEKI
jgi:hypothetical protein